MCHLKNGWILLNISSKISHFVATNMTEPGNRVEQQEYEYRSYHAGLPLKMLYKM